MSKTIKRFKRERNRALPTLNEKKIREFYKKWDMELPEDPAVFWAAVHKAITAIPTLNKELRRKSKEWLTERGLSSLDDGDI